MDLTLQGGRYDGLTIVDLRMPEGGRPPDAPFWLAAWGHIDYTSETGKVPARVTHPSSYTTHDDPSEFAARHSREDCRYYLCKDGQARSAKFAAWVEARIG